MAELLEVRPAEVCRLVVFEVSGVVEGVLDGAVLAYPAVDEGLGGGVGPLLLLVQEGRVLLAAKVEVLLGLRL